MNLKKRIASITATVIAFVFLALPYSNSGVYAVDFGEVLETVCTALSPSDGNRQSRNTYTSTISGESMADDTACVTVNEVAFENIYHINSALNKKATSDITYTTIETYTALSPSYAPFELVEPDSNIVAYGDSSENFQLEWTGSGVPISFESDNSYVSVNSDGYVSISRWLSDYSASQTVTITASNYSYSDSVSFTLHAATTTGATTTLNLYGMPFELVEPYSYYEAGDSFQLEWTGEGIPYNFGSDNSCVDVDSDGYVYIGYSYNEQTVTITASNSGYSDSVSFKILPPKVSETTTVPPSYINLYSVNSSDLDVGNSFQIEYDAKYYSSIYWESSDKSIASVDSDGYVTIKGYGEVTISATAESYYGYNNSDSITFIVPYPTPIIELAPPDEADCFVGNILPIQYNVSNADSIKWSSSNENVASIDNKGYITVTGIGKVTITAVASNEYGESSSDSLTIYTYQSGTTVSDGSMQIIPSSVTMSVGDTNELLLLNIPDNSTVKWTSDNTSIATVTNGTVKAVKAGSATIYATAGNNVAKCTVKVIGNGVTLAGDANGDGTVTIADAVAVSANIANATKNPLSAVCAANADVYMTGDGLNASDAFAIQQFATGVISRLPV